MTSFDPLPDAPVDRETYLRLVGIDPRTLTRWVKERIVTPIYPASAKGQMFSPADVRDGKALAALLKSQPGSDRLAQAASIVRGETLPPRWPVDPAAPFPPPDGASEGG